VISCPEDEENLNRYNADDRDAFWKTRSEDTTGNGRDDIAEGIDHAVPVIIQGNSLSTVAVDDERCVFENFPSALQRRRDQQPVCRRVLPECERDQGVEKHAVNDVRERIRIE